MQFLNRWFEGPLWPLELPDLLFSPAAPSLATVYFSLSHNTGSGLPFPGPAPADLPPWNVWLKHVFMACFLLSCWSPPKCHLSRRTPLPPLATLFSLLVGWFNFFYLLTWERERHWFVFPLIYAFICCFFYVPRPGIKPTTLANWNNALDNWATWPVSFLFFFFLI